MPRKHYDYTIIELYAQLKRTGVLNNVKEIYENERSTALVIVVTKSRFFAECVTINRISRQNYHINSGSEHIRTRTAHQGAKQVKRLINNIIFQGD